jgi:hypothetical protein
MRVKDFLLAEVEREIARSRAGPGRGSRRQVRLETP